MGIDRQNIPDEYLCEICQPRPVDKPRARSLQLMKRKEQTQMLINAAQFNAAGTANSSGVGNSGILMQQQDQFLANSGISSVLSPALQGAGQSSLDHRVSSSATGTSNRNTNSVGGKKGGKLSGSTKKREVLKKNKKEKAGTKKRGPGGGNNTDGGSSVGKRTTKRKTKASNSNETAADKYASNLRQWIENYEVAMTNHYSPELRARLHAISKQQNLLQSITATENKLLKNLNGGNLENRCTTVPHAGGKILISNHDIQPNSPIVELRGKYMLTTQYKNQNPSMFMNTPPNSSSGFHHHNMNNYQKNYQKIPGPFIFFYQLSLDNSTNTTTLVSGNIINGPEICVDTRTYGNEARFVRRSCRPNAEIQHSFEKGTIHLYLVSLTNIMASTEITIRHEPHDLAALENKNNFNFPIAPTSTICACGLTKDCTFNGNQLLMQMMTTSLQSKGANRKITLNGCLNESGGGKKKTTSQNQGRGRSTSSSGESNAGLMSPNNSNFTQNLYNSAASISNLLHDSGVYTSSSSPSVSLPSPTHTQTVSSPPQQQNSQQPQQAQQQLLQKSQQSQQSQQQPQSQLSQIQQNIQPTNAGVIPGIIPTPLPAIPMDAGAEATITQPSVNTNNNIVGGVISSDNITSTGSHHPTPMKSPQKSTVGNRKTPGKQGRHSISEDGSQSGSSSQQEEKRESRKLTREERKMEAIVKAFEKMEKNQQRKQELKQAKTSGLGSSKRRNSSSPSPKRVKTTGSGESGAENTSSQQHHHTPGRRPGSRKKKRKGSKSYQSQASIQRKRRRSRINSNESDMMTSEESSSILSPATSKCISISGNIVGGINTITAPLQPPPVASSVNSNKIPEIVEKQMTLMTDLIESQASGDGGISQAAGLLMAFANPDKIVNHHKNRERINSVDSNGSNSGSVSLLQGKVYMDGQQIQDQCSLRNSPILNHHIPDSLNHQIPIQQLQIKPELNDNISNVISSTPSVITSMHDNKMSPLRHRRSIEMSPIRQNQQVPIPQNSPQTPPIGVSSTCLLVEAAVGPLENFENSGSGNVGLCNEFKIPIRTKTKKSIMNDWLNQSSDANSEIIYQNATSGSMNQIVEEVDSLQHTASLLPPSAQIIVPTEEMQHQQIAGLAVNYHQDKNLDTLVQAAATICNYRVMSTPSPSAVTVPTGPPSPSCTYIPGTSLRQEHQQKIEPQNLTMVAKKVEEFIHQNDSGFVVCSSSNSCSEEMMKMGTSSSIEMIPSYSTIVTAGAVSTSNDQILPQSHNSQMFNLQNLSGTTVNSNTCGSSSVKKRWLRQAISEETDEISNGNSNSNSSSNSNNVPMAASSPTLQQPATPPNDFTTPLKKRRVIRQCNDKNDDEQISNSSPEDMSSSATTLTLATKTDEGVDQQQQQQQSCFMRLSQENINENSSNENKVEEETIKINDENNKKEMVVEEDSGCGVINRNKSGENNSSGDIGVKEEISSNEIEDDMMVDIINSPSPNDKIVADDGNLVKIEPEDVNREIKVDVEKEEGSSNDDTAITTATNISDNGSKMVIIKENDDDSIKTNEIEMKDDIKTDVKLNLIIKKNSPKLEEIVKKEEEIEPEEEKKSIKPLVEFKTKISSSKLKHETTVSSTTDKKSSPITPSPPPPPSQTVLMRSRNSLLMGLSAPSSSNYENVSDEIADIEKRLDSFHTENIMFLQSRNKKSKNRLLKINNSNGNNNSTKNNGDSGKNDEFDSSTTHTVSLTDDLTIKSHDQIKDDEKSSSDKKSSIPTITTTKVNKKDGHHRHSKNSSKKRTLSESNKEKDEIISPMKLRKESEFGNSRKRKDLSLSKLESDRRFDNDVANKITENRARKSLDDEIMRTMTAKDPEPRIKIEQSFGRPLPSLPQIDDKQLQAAALTIPNFNQSILPPTAVGGVSAIQQGAISSYITNLSPPAVLVIDPKNPNYDISTLLTAQPPPPLPLPAASTVVATVTLASGPVINHNNNNNNGNLMINSVVQQQKQQQPQIYHSQPPPPPPPLHLPYYNTIYGKLMDKTPVGNPVINHPQTVSSSCGQISSASTTGNNNNNNSSSSSLLLSDYLDTKAKSYSTLGGYVSHSALFGLKSGKNSGGTVNTSSTGSIGANSSIDSVLSNVVNNTSTNCKTGPSKILTKTASSDPRLNPILTAPEPPPAPKRKVS